MHSNTAYMLTCLYLICENSDNLCFSLHMDSVFTILSISDFTRSITCYGIKQFKFFIKMSYFLLIHQRGYNNFELRIISKCGLWTKMLSYTKPYGRNPLLQDLDGNRKSRINICLIEEQIFTIFNHSSKDNSITNLILIIK